MKILHLVQKPQLRGAELFACLLSTQLGKLGHESLIVTLFKGDATLPYSGKVIHLGLDPAKRMVDFAGWRRIANLIKDEAPDVVQANAGDTLKYSVLSRLFFRWKTPLVYRNASTISLYIKRAPVLWWNAFLFRFVDYIISVSQTTQRDLVALFPHTARRTCVVPVGISTDESYELPEAPAPPLLLHVGGFTFEKNHKDLLAIFEKVLGVCPTAHLWMVGDGPLRKEVEAVASYKKLNGHITFWGYQTNPLRFMEKADALLLPSVIEGLPTVILEAFYCRLPVIAYDTGGISELVMHRKTGWLVDKGNQDDFVSAVLECLGEEGRRNDIIDRASALIKEKYTIERVARDFLTAYTSLTGKP